MESTIVAPQSGKIAAVVLTAGQLVEQDDLIIEMGK
jgi:biotin carboxyl carrier protein